MSEISTPVDLLRLMFDGAVTAAQGLGRSILAGFQSVLRGVTINAETGVATYGETYTELAQFLMTFAGVGIGAGVAYMFVRWLWARKRG